MRLSRRRFLAASSGIGLTAASRAPVPSERQAHDPLGVAADFPLAATSTYLNSAYIGPTPLPVVHAGRSFLESKAVRPISLTDMLAETDVVRRRFARFIGADAEEVGFLFATSEGENILAGALDLGAGDNVVVDELHYLTTFVLYRHLAQTRRIELRIVPARDGRVEPRDFEPLVDKRTRLVSVAWVSHQNGFRHDLRPLAELAHAHGAWLYTDAVQAAGMFPIDVKPSGVDCLTSGTYKWLLAGYGVAPFYVRRELLDRVAPDRYGALHVEKELGGYEYQLFSTAKKFEYATLAFASVYQLGVALQYLERVGVDRIEAHGVGLARRLRRALAEAGLRVLTPEGNGSSIVSFANPSTPERARQILESAGIEVSYRAGGTEIRASPALFNTEADVDRLVEHAARLT